MSHYVQKAYPIRSKKHLYHVSLNEIPRNPHFNFKYEALWPVYQGIPDTSEDVNY